MGVWRKNGHHSLCDTGRIDPWHRHRAQKEILRRSDNYRWLCTVRVTACRATTVTFGWSSEALKDRGQGAVDCKIVVGNREVTNITRCCAGCANSRFRALYGGEIPVGTSCKKQRPASARATCRWCAGVICASTLPELRPALRPLQHNIESAKRQSGHRRATATARASPGEMAPFHSCARPGRDC